MKPHMVGKATPAQAVNYMSDVFRLNVERAAAKHLLRDIAEQGYTPELAAKVRTFLERHPGQ